jgi:predicted O-linked N-acetylglucosamine transferase (SPINDLY family)
MAYRPAPIQAHLIGWATLIEAPYIDYLITDPHYHPQYLRDMTTETYALMPEGSWVYLPVEVADLAQEPPTRSGPFRFCSFNHLGKIDRETFEAWMEILRRTENSILTLCHWNLGDAVRNMLALTERAGIDPARLQFLPVISHTEHLRQLQTMDLALDTLRMGGGVTTMDMIWAGVPLLSACTHKNYLHSSRGAFGSLSMSEELATDVSDYINRAVELRNNPNRLAALRQKILSRRQGSLMFDPPRYAAELQRIILAMWERHLRGEKPATFTLLKSHQTH